MTSYSMFVFCVVLQFIVVAIGIKFVIRAVVSD